MVDALTGINIHQNDKALGVPNDQIYGTKVCDKTEVTSEDAEQRISSQEVDTWDLLPDQLRYLQPMKEVKLYTPAYLESINLS